MHKILQEILLDTFIKNPIWGILISIFGFIQFNSSTPKRHPGVIFGIGIVMVFGSAWIHYTSWKQKRKNPSAPYEE